MNNLESAIAAVAVAEIAVESAKQAAKATALEVLDGAGITDGFEFMYTKPWAGNTPERYRVTGIEPSVWNSSRGRSIHASATGITVSCDPLKADGTRHRGRSVTAIPIQFILAARAEAGA